MFYHIDFPIQQKDPESAWQKQLARERAKQEEREAKILELIDATIQRFAQNDTNGYTLNPSDKEYYLRRAKLYTDITERPPPLTPCETTPRSTASATNANVSAKISANSWKKPINSINGQ